MAFQGDQYEKRIGPVAVPIGYPTIDNVLITFAEPLRLVNVVLTNRTTDPLFIALALVPFGATLGTEHLLLTITLAGSDVLNYTFNIPVELGDKIMYAADDEGINLNATVTRKDR